MKPANRLPLAFIALPLVLAGCAGIRSEEPSIDQAFIDMMVPHHEAAVAMAKLAVEEAERPELRDMANEIIAAQSAEIDQLRGWREEWFGSADTPSMNEMPMLPGMSMEGGAMSGDTMDMTAEIDSLRGAEPFDRFFIDAMIRHHEQAVEAARIVREESDRQEVRQLAEAIIETQTAEIQQLREWRREWY